jgi:hypothetical protein
LHSNLAPALSPPFALAFEVSPPGSHDPLRVLTTLAMTMIRPTAELLTGHED